MSNTQSSSQSSVSYSSYSSSSSSGGHTSATSYSEQIQSTPSGTTIHTVSQNAGEPAVRQTQHFDAEGRQLVGGEGYGDGQRMIEEVKDGETEADKQYREKMEDEYAKREGGA